MSDLLVGYFVASKQNNSYTIANHGLLNGDTVRFALGAVGNALPSPWLKALGITSSTRPKTPSKSVRPKVTRCLTLRIAAQATTKQESRANCPCLEVRTTDVQERQSVSARPDRSECLRRTAGSSSSQANRQGDRRHKHLLVSHGQTGATHLMRKGN